MSGSSKFYYKEGKLELSMLDEENYENEKEILDDVYNVRNQALDSKLVVSSDVYNTLHLMGKYLTKQDEKSIEKEASIEEKTSIEEEENRYESSITKEDEITHSEKDVIIQLGDNDKERDHSLPHSVNETDLLSQQAIDCILEENFKDSNAKPYIYANELKKHIDQQIEAIKNFN